MDHDDSTTKQRGSDMNEGRMTPTGKIIDASFLGGESLERSDLIIKTENRRRTFAY